MRTAALYGTPATRHTVLAIRDGSAHRRPDRLAAEQPLEIRIAAPGLDPTTAAVTMRTPGDDFELAAGFLFTEGIVGSREDILTIRYCDRPGQRRGDTAVTVTLRRPLAYELPARNFAATSSCGLCGTASLEQAMRRCPPVAPGPVVEAGLFSGLPDALRARQRVFDSTGGLHAAGLFTAEAHLIDACEDIGRHNAVDKLAGRLLLSGGTPAATHLMLVSGRVSHEIVQKAAMAGVPLLAAVSAPSSLAVATAEELGMTVVGFLRGDGFNVYCHPQRIAARAA
jgi:FdhD protein